MEQRQPEGRAVRVPLTETVFYDGHCALCHGFVKFLLKRDSGGAMFRFAPLQGPTSQKRVPAPQRADLPDSVVVLTSTGELLARSRAVIHVLRHLGKGWKIAAGLLAVIPRPVRDALYDFVAGVRYRVFGRSADICPVIPPELRQRFDP
jgi:predicted DCC family thiol-disulfide oxidoreductase YuxK